MFGIGRFVKKKADQARHGIGKAVKQGVVKPVKAAGNAIDSAGSSLGNLAKASYVNLQDLVTGAAEKRKEEQKKNEVGKSDLGIQKAAWEANTPERERAEHEQMQNQIHRNTQEAKVADLEARNEGRKYADEVLNREVRGFSPEQRNAMQYKSEKGIRRNSQLGSRKLLGEQAKHGILGKGGVAYAQQRDLQRMAQEQLNAANNELNLADIDQSNRNRVAGYGIEQSERANSGLNRQAAADEIRTAEEKRRQRINEDRFNNYLMNI